MNDENSLLVYRFFIKNYLYLNLYKSIKINCIKKLSLYKNYFFVIVIEDPVAAIILLLLLVLIGIPDYRLAFQPAKIILGGDGQLHSVSAVLEFGLGVTFFAE